MLLLLLALQATPARIDSIPGTDSIPRITLAEAVRRSSRFDPDYVRALGQIDNAEWGRRAAMLAFFIPSVDLGLGAGSLSRRPLGYAIVGGLIFSTALTLYVVPAVYVIFEGLFQRRRARAKARGTLAPAEAD